MERLDLRELVRVFGSAPVGKAAGGVNIRSSRMSVVDLCREYDSRPLCESVRYQTLNAARKDKEPRAEVAADAEVKKGEEYSFLKQFHRPPRPLRPLREAF